MKRRIFAFIMLILTALLLAGCGYAGPEKAVRQEMELIRRLDEPTIKAYVSYEDIRLSHSAPLEIGEETTEAIRLFFQNFDYRIRSSSVSEDETTATVELNITNLDAKMLAKDLCRAMIEASVTPEGGVQEGLASSFALMKQCLKEHTYPLVTIPATVNLVNSGGSWVIQESAELEDALAGGLVTYLRDPDLLTPEEVLECTLRPLDQFSAQDWISYLDLNDVFNIGPPLAGDMDQAIAEQIARFFRYEIVDVTQEEEQATARITVYSLNLKDIINRCRNYLLDYAQTTESIRATDSEITQMAAQFLLEALQDNTQASSNTIDIPMVNNGHTWEVQLNEGFADALLGGVNLAAEALYPVTEESGETETEAGS